MDIRQLKYFHTIAQEGQISRAAKKLHMAQPPLSQSLKSLENELGVMLFERNGRNMELTKAGEVLFKRANEFLHQLNETINEVRDTEMGYKGTVSFGCVKSYFAHIPDKIKAFRANYPQINFEFRVGDSYLLAELLKNRDIEFAFIRLPLQYDKALSHYILPDEPYVVAIPETWKDNFHESSVYMEELANLPLLLLHRINGIGQYELINDEFLKRNLYPNIICECPDVDMLLELVSNEIGATIVPESTLLRNNIRGVHKLQIKDATIISKSAIIWLKDRYISQSASRFISLFLGNDGAIDFNQVTQAHSGISLTEL